MLTENLISEFLKEIRKDTAESWLASVSDGVRRKKMAKKPPSISDRSSSIHWSRSGELEHLQKFGTWSTDSRQDKACVGEQQASDKLLTHAPWSWILSLLFFQSCTKTNCMVVCDAAWIQWKKFHLAFELHWDVDFQKWFKTPSWQTPQFYRFIWFPHYPHFFIPIWLWNEGKKSSETCWAHVFKYSS